VQTKEITFRGISLPNPSDPERLFRSWRVVKLGIVHQWGLGWKKLDFLEECSKKFLDLSSQWRHHVLHCPSDSIPRLNFKLARILSVPEYLGSHKYILEPGIIKSMHESFSMFSEQSETVIWNFIIDYQLIYYRIEFKAGMGKKGKVKSNPHSKIDQIMPGHWKFVYWSSFKCRIWTRWEKKFPVSTGL
jgi:hypothetical protein